MKDEQENTVTAKQVFDSRIQLSIKRTCHVLAALLAFKITFAQEKENKSESFSPHHAISFVLSHTHVNQGYK